MRAAWIGPSTGFLAESAPASLADHWPALVIIAVLSLAALVLMVILARYLRLCVNIFLDTPLPVTANLQDYEPPTGEVVAFPSLDGRSLRGMFVERPKGAPERGLVIFCHEFASDMFSAGRYAWPLVEAGYEVFTFDFRGHGRSFTPPHFEPRHWPSHHEVNDVRAAVAYVQSCRDLGRRGLGVLGVSRGASAAAVAAVLEPAIRCLALDGVFSTDYTIEQLITRWGQIFARVNLASPPVCRFMRAMTMLYVELKLRCRFPSMKKALARLRDVPMLFISGERDTYVRPEHTRALYEQKPGGKDLWICPGAKHNQAVVAERATYAAHLVAFFDRYLCGPDAAEEPRQKAG